MTRLFRRIAEIMNVRDHVGLRHWMVALVVVILLAGHAVMLYYVSSNIAVPAVIIFAVIVLVVLKHLGFLSSLYGALCRRSQKK